MDAARDRLTWQQLPRAGRLLLLASLFAALAAIGFLA
jgi:hypothetical protein